MASCLPAKLRQLQRFRLASDILQKDYYGWFERVKRGVYRLKPDGAAAITEHAEVIEAWLKGRDSASQYRIKGNTKHEQHIRQ